jgi:hypothetical protein
MVLKVPISPAAEAKLRKHADAAGLDLETYAAKWLESLAAPPLSTHDFGRSSSDTANRADMTEEEMSEFIETEVHAMRAEKRARRES